MFRNLTASLSTADEHMKNKNDDPKIELRLQQQGHKQVNKHRFHT